MHARKPASPSSCHHTYVLKLSKVLPAKKVARYMQIESKIRAIVKYDLANAIPLVQ